MAVATELAVAPRTAQGRTRKPSLWARFMDFLPRGNLLDDAVWRKRHALLQNFLLLHLPLLLLFGLWMRHSPTAVLLTVAPIPVFRLLGALPVRRRLASFFTTAGILYCSVALVGLSNGSIEAHFHFFIVIGFIALYQDWVPFGWDIAFTVLSHGIGSAFKPNLIFNSMAGMQHPWTWSLIHGVAVLAACVGLILFWRTNEDEQQKTLALTRKLSQAEIDRRQFTSELLVNLARRNQSLLYRQLDIINQLEQHEKDPDALGNLFRLDHLATRIRRNAENLIVLSGEEPPRVWGKPVPLTEVVRAAIAETEDLRRVSFSVDERLALMGHAVVDLTHLLAELIENAVRFSPPETQVTVRTTPDVRAAPGTVMLTVEDWGVGMPSADLETANQILAKPQDVDASGSSRLGLHVIARLANRYSIKVVLTTTSGSGITAVVLLPPDLFTTIERPQPVTITQQPVASTPQPVAIMPERVASPPQPVARTPEPVAAAFGPDEARPVPGLPGPQRRSDAVLQVQVDNLGRANQWDGWWERNGESAAPEPAASQSPIRLARRVPQTHLAPELQRDHGPTTQSPAAAPSPSPSPDAARAREALSRYQASRQAALAEHDPAERTRT